MKTKLLDADGLWEYALRCLDRKHYSAAELKSKLMRRAAPGALAPVMAKLEEYSLLNDRQFAESFATARLESSGFGARRVMRDLRARRVPENTAQTVVQQVYGSVDETNLVRQYLERKLRSKDLSTFLKEPKNLASAYRRLRTAGFSAGPSIKVLREYTQNAEQLEDSEPDSAGEADDTEEMN